MSASEAQLAPRAKAQTLLWAVVAVAIIAGTALVLHGMGRIWICKCGTVKLWHGVVVSSENSQHLSDWYTPSHVIHGFVFYFGLWLLQRWTGWRMSFGAMLAAALLVECGWEIIENTNAVIEHYRSVTISLDYYGDSVINSVADILAMVAGFFLARLLPVAVTVAIAIFLELFVGFMIRDNLTLNVIMLLYPLESIKAWQSGA